jgi:hypothetical protein
VVSVEAAIAYAGRGWHVLPIQARSKEPAALGPRGRRLAYTAATTDREQLLTWWRRAPEANVGIRCDASGLLVVDVDPRNGGDDRLHELERTLGPLPSTVEAFTGGGGQHLIFATPGADVSPVGDLGDGVDVKYRGYIVAPPSLHPSGRGYEWSVDGHPDARRPAALPARWLEAIVPSDRRAPVPPKPAGSAHGEDWLRARLPVEYVRLIAGIEVAPDSKARCPFHDDVTPSMHVYPNAEGLRSGWYCYGCRRGGSIFEFAAFKVGYLTKPGEKLRGVKFLRIEQALLKLYAKHLGVPEAA